MLFNPIEGKIATTSTVAADDSQPAIALKTACIDGQDICYFDSGDGPVLLLIHGMYGDHTDWEPVLRPLAEHHRVIALDLPGFGLSSKPHVDYSADFFVSALEAFLKHLEVPKAIFVGNSFGGIICMLYALAHPERTSGLVLIDSGGFYEWSPQEREDAQSRFRKERLRKLSPEIHRRLFGSIFVNGPSSVASAYMSKQDKKLIRADFEQYVHAIHSSVQLALDEVLLDRLPEIKCPVLILQGAKDEIVKMEWVKEGASRFLNAQMKVVDDCGHVPQLESPQEVVRLMSEFMSKL